MNTITAQIQNTKLKHLSCISGRGVQHTEYVVTFDILDILTVRKLMFYLLCKLTLVYGPQPAAGCFKTGWLNQGIRQNLKFFNTMFKNVSMFSLKCFLDQ